MPRTICKISFCFALFVQVCAGVQTQRNVIVVFCDDLGYGELPVYRALYRQSPEFETAIGSFTPNLDRLAKKGVVCTRAYGNNTCAPARMSLLSGMWPTRRVSLGGQPLIGRAMREHGLKTAHYGKYHHEVEKTITMPFHKNLLEFDEFMGFEAMSNYFRRADEHVEPRKNAPITYRVGEQLMAYQFSKKGVYLTDQITEHGVDFIRRCSTEDKPFFLYLPYNAPHTPIQAKPEDLKTLFPNRTRSPSNRQKIMAMVYALDRGVGRLLETLEETDQLDRTLILFAGDNGGEASLSLTYPMHGYKHEPFDGGIRVPYIVWSSQLEAAAKKPASYDALVSLCDMFPTALKYVNPATDLSNYRLDGVDLMPFLMGEQPPLTGRRYVNLRTLNHRSNTWDGGRDTPGKTTGTCIALIEDDFKIMKLFQNSEDRSNYSYSLHHQEDMRGKHAPAPALREDYYKDTTENPDKRKTLIRDLEHLLEDGRLN